MKLTRVTERTHARASKLAQSLKVRRIDMVYEAAVNVFVKLPADQQQAAITAPTTSKSKKTTAA